MIFVLLKQKTFTINIKLPGYELLIYADSTTNAEGVESINF